MKSRWISFACAGLLMLMLSIEAKAQEPLKPFVFTGGMFLHGGYIQNARENENVNGFTSGIGGQGFFHLGKHFRLGTEGYGSTHHYADNPGYYKLGWGGVLAGYQLEFGRVKPMFSVTFGGGKVHDLFLHTGQVNDDLPDLVVYRVYSNMLVVPAISLHYALKKRINLAFKADFAMPLGGQNRPDYAYGPRFYMGILFNK